ncbi:Aste57867_13151 [Aphanomyces stellatus]|uniref:Aste57867_13151 protein n=1 Tax=Aphanomyces stellatus TaxID=120398 RepID=A0A485KZG8_9STRA|nr:hypothetical protein As57867_013102 [Aphanomyces stellatus]VFT89992.1 Aste57867_13151 [Aphanomyces stellatus]
MCVLMALTLLGYAVATVGVVLVWHVYVAPYMVCNAYMVLVTYLQHTDTYIPHFRGDEWTWLRGALCTVDRSFGTWIDGAIHHIADTHVTHHLFGFHFTMPSKRRGRCSCSSAPTTSVTRHQFQRHSCASVATADLSTPVATFSFTKRVGRLVRGMHTPTATKWSSRRQIGRGNLQPSGYFRTTTPHQDRGAGIGRVASEMERPAIVNPVEDDKPPKKKPTQSYAELNPHHFPLRTLGLFTLKNPWRRLCMRITDNRFFNWFIMLTVLINTFSMTFARQNITSSPDAGRDKAIATVESVTLCVYIAEMTLKMVAQGCWGRHAYFSDNWNCLDFVVIVTGIIITAYNDTSSIALIRCLRILRPLRTLRSFPGLKMLVNALLSALPSLANVSVLLCFSYVVFSILGVGIWSGAYHHRCRLTEFPVTLNFTASDAPANFTYPDPGWISTVLQDPNKHRCTELDVDESWTTPQSCFWPLDPSDTVGLYCGGRECNPGTTCGSNYDRHGNPRFQNIVVNGTLAFSLMSEPDFTANLNFGLTNFDNVGSGLVIVLQTVTASGWMVLTQTTQDCFSWVGAGVYFNVVLFIGMCFLLQINMAIMVSAFVTSKENQQIVQHPPPKPRAAPRMRKSLTNHIAIKTKALHQDMTRSRVGLLVARGRAWLLWLVTAKPFRRVAFVFTLVNIIALALHMYPMVDGVRATNLEIVQFVCLVFFVLELLCHLVAHGPTAYFSSGLNVIDAASIIVGVVDAIIDPPGFIDGSISRSNPFIALRALRAIKLAQTFKPLKRLMLAIGGAMGEFLNFLFFLTVFIYIFALLGMELFAGKFYFDESNRPLVYAYSATGVPAPLLTVNRHRSHFDTIDAAAFTVFQVITYDDFPAIMYDGWLTAGLASPFYFASIVVLGVWVVMNMFSAITVNSVMDAVDGDDDQDPAKAEMKRSLSKMRYLERSVARLDITGSSKAAAVLTERPSEAVLRTQWPLRHACLMLTRSRAWTLFVVGTILVASVMTAFDTPLLDPNDQVGQIMDALNHTFAVLFTTEMVVELLANGVLKYIKDPWKVLDALIVGVSLLSWSSSWSIVNFAGIRSLRCLRALRPLRVINQMPQLKVVVNTLFRCAPDIAKALLFFAFSLFMFGIACVLFFQGGMSTCSTSPYQYLDNPMYMPPPPWFPPSYAGSYSMADLKLYDVMTFPRAWRDLTPASQQVLAPVLATCPFPPAAATDPTFVPTSKQMCLCFAGMTWQPQVPQSFDNVLVAMGSLYELTTMEGWTAVAYAGVDSRGPDLQPIVDSTRAILLFWVLFMISCAFFMTNLFLGILCDAFMREKYGGFLTDDQIKWINFQRKLIAIEPLQRVSRPRQPWRQPAYDIVHSEAFDVGITCAILVNTIALALTYFGQPPLMDFVLNVINYAFSALFLVEAALKLVGIGPRTYFGRGWDRFDFFILVLTLISSVLPFVLADKFNLGAGAMVVRVFRVGRALRLINKAKLMRSLFDTIIIALPAVTNVTGLLMLMYYIYAAVGVQLFAKVGFGTSMLNSQQNFQTFWIALQTLIGFSTGENWDNFMWELYNIAPDSNPGCVDRAYNGSLCGFNTTFGCTPLDGCGTWTIIPYMYTFELIVGYIGLNLFSGILVDAVADADTATSSAVLDLQDFARLWCDYDPRGSCRIELDELALILKRMSPPFGYRGLDGYSLHRIRKALGDTGIMVYDAKYVHFRDVPRALALRSVSQGDPDKFQDINSTLDELGITKDFYRAWGRRYKKGQDTLAKMAPTATVDLHVAQLIIARWHRRHKRRQTLQDSGVIRRLIVAEVVHEMCAKVAASDAAVVAAFVPSTAQHPAHWHM